MSRPDGIEVNTASVVGSDTPSRWIVACTVHMVGRSFGSEEDADIWIAAHVDAHHGEAG